MIDGESPNMIYLATPLENVDPRYITIREAHLRDGEVFKLIVPSDSAETKQSEDKLKSATGWNAKCTYSLNYL